MARSNRKPCPGCNGRMMVRNDKTGVPVVCPLCDGEGVREHYERMPRWYIINEALLAAGTNRGALTIDSLADFELIWLCRTAGGGTFTAEFQDRSGRAWQNLPVNDLNMFGTAVAPFPIGLSPVVLRAQTSLQYTLVDTSGNPNAVQIALIGYDLYLADD